MRVILETLTAVHIGSGEKYPPCNLVLHDGNAQGGKAKKKEGFRLKTRKFLEVLRRHPEISKKLSSPLNEKAIKDVEKLEDGIFYKVSVYSDFQRTRNPEIIEEIHHPNGSLYIPGSSLKGAIRLALTWYVLKNNERFLENFKRNVGKELANSKGRSFPQTNQYLNSIFRIEKVPEDRRDNVFTDFHRFLRISDSDLLEEATVVHDVGVFYVGQTARKDQKPLNPKLTFPVEFIPVKKRFQLIVDFKEQEYYYFLKNIETSYGVKLPTSLEEILKITDNFYREIVKFEKGKFQDAKKEGRFSGMNVSKIEERFAQIEGTKGYLVHIGYGGGLMANSLFILLDEETRKRVRNLIKPHDEDEAPLTRRYLVQTADDGSMSIISPIGWCRICLEDSQCT